MKKRESLPVLGSAEISRRTLLSGVARGGCALALMQFGCTVAEVTCDDARNITFSIEPGSPFAVLEEVGEMLAVDAGCLKLVLIRRSEEEIIALDRICPHAFCEMSPGQSGVWVQGTGDAEYLECTCHTSRFAADGSKISGPTPTGVDSFPVSFNPDTGRWLVEIESAAGNQG